MAVEPKLLRAAEEDEAANERAYEQLLAFAHRRLKIRIKDPAASDRDIIVSARILEEPELAEYSRRLWAINPELIKAKKAEDIVLTPQENEKLTALHYDYVSKATGYTVDQVKALGNRKVISTLLLSILRQSNPSKEELEEISKFRADT